MTNTETDRLAAVLYKCWDGGDDDHNRWDEYASRLIAAGVRLDGISGNSPKFNIEPSFIQFNPVPKPSSTKKVRGKKTIDPVSEE